MLIMEKKGGGGRPPKFDEPSRPITLTLPDSTLEGLKEINADRAQAIVSLTQSALRQQGGASAGVEVLKMGPDTGLLVVGPSEYLKKIPFLRLVEVAPARFILALDKGNDFKNLEIALNDLIDDASNTHAKDRVLLEQLLEHVRRLRKAEKVTMAEIVLVKLSG